MQPITPEALIALIDRDGAKAAGHYTLIRQAERRDRIERGASGRANT